MNVELSQDDVQNIINAYDKDIKKMKQQENEIDRLNNLNKQLVEECQKLDDEETRLNNIINELEEYINPYLYMLNGIQDRDIYEQCQLDDFTDIMEKLQELKEE